MKKKHGIFLGIISIAVMGVSLSAQEGEGGKASLTLDFSASIVSVNSDGDVDSFADAGFGEDNESTLSFSYESEFFGGVASLGFYPMLHYLFSNSMGDDAGANIFTIDELYAWIRPFGEHFKFTAGIFENTDGVTDYTDDIDNFKMGVFYDGTESMGPYTEPVWYFTAALENGFLSEASFGPITAQFLLAPNFGDKTAAAFLKDPFTNSMAMFGVSNYNHSNDAGGRLFRLGGRLIAEFEDTITVSTLFKLESWPTEIMNNFFQQIRPGSPPVPGSVMHQSTFGAYLDITAIENLGISLGYTGFMVPTDDGDAKASLWNGIDLRATWTGIEGLSISTHNNISFSNGKDWYLGRGENGTFFNLYNAFGLTKTLTEQFGINMEIGNVFSKTNYDNGIPKTEYNNFWGQAKLIASPVENAEFSVGLRFEGTKQDDDNLTTVFSVPIGITVSF
jgi:hypothetical protein